MSAEDGHIPKEFREALRLAEQLRLRRSLRPGAGQLFTDELQQMIDRDAVKHQSLNDALKHILALSRELVGRICFRVVYGYAQPAMCEEARMHLGDMLAENKISYDEWQRASWQRLIRIGDDERLYVVGPPKRNLLMGKLAVTPIIIAVSFGIVMILDEPFNLLNSVSSGLLLGVLLGGVGKAIYDCSWGHLSLAKKLRYLCAVPLVQMCKRGFCDEGLPGSH